MAFDRGGRSHRHPRAEISADGRDAPPTIAFDIDIGPAAEVHKTTVTSWQCERPERNDMFGWRKGPLGADASLCVSARRSPSQGIDPGGWAPTIRRRRLDPCDGAAGDRTLGPSAGGNGSPQASLGGTNGFGRRANTPPTIARILTRRPMCTGRRKPPSALRTQFCRTQRDN